MAWLCNSRDRDCIFLGVQSVQCPLSERFGAETGRDCSVSPDSLGIPGLPSGGGIGGPASVTAQFNAPLAHQWILVLLALSR